MPAVERFVREPGTTRALPRWLAGLVVVLLGARVATGLYERDHPSVPRSLVSWVDLEEAEALSRERGLPILYDFTADWCTPCHWMDRDVFHKDTVAREINLRFIPVRVKDRENEEGANSAPVQHLLTKYQVKGFPHLVIVPPGGGEVRRQVGYDGYTDTVRFLGVVP